MNSLLWAALTRLHSCHVGDADTATLRAGERPELTQGLGGSGLLLCVQSLCLLFNSSFRHRGLTEIKFCRAGFEMQNE